MDESAITVRYAKALFSLAKEKNQLARLKDDMDLVMAVVSQSEDFNRLLKNPVVKTSEKNQIFQRIFKGKISDSSLQFLGLVVQNRREELIPSIGRHILTLIRKEKNIKTAVITTAYPLDEKLLEKTRKVLEQELKTQVELSAKVNPQIIGGMILRIDDRQYDASILTDLNKIKQELLKV